MTLGFEELFYIYINLNNLIMNRYLYPCKYYILWHRICTMDGGTHEKRREKMYLPNV